MILKIHRTIKSLGISLPGVYLNYQPEQILILGGFINHYVKINYYHFE